uniref:Elongation factor 1-beta n=1 Tax=Leptobrachium leishanense TaxID=445787 RepID=A0A8C5LRB5_9ANUR
MGFGELKSHAGLQVLNEFLADKTYIERYVPSQADIAEIEALSGAPPADLYHALRWYNHIKSYEKQVSSLRGVKKELGKYGPVNIEDTADTSAMESKEDDDVTDLFGSHVEVEGEGAKRIREERLAQCDSKKNQKITGTYLGTDLLEESITAFEDFVQSMDVAAFNKF